MKNNYKNIIKRTVDNHSDDINPDMIWSGIESKLGQKKQKRFAGYWIFCGFSLVAIALISMFIWSADDSGGAENVEKYASLDAEVIEKAKPQNKKINTVVDQLNADTDEVQSASSKEEDLSESDAEYRNGDARSDDEVVTQIYDVNRIAVDHQKSNNSVTQKISIEEEFEQAVEVQVNELQEAKESVALATSTTMHSREPLFISKANVLEIEGLDIFQREIEVQTSEPYVFHPAYSQPEKSVSFLTGLELYSGLSFGEKTVSDIDQSYAQVRNSSEQLLEQWSAGLRVDLVNVLDFKLKSGLRYSMITDKMQRENEFRDLAEYSFTTSQLIDGALVLVDSMTVVDGTGKGPAYTTEQYNSQRVITIPLEVSFGRSFDRFEIGVGFGVDINYHLSDTHIILNQEGKASVNKVGGMWVSPSFSGALYTGYHLNDRWAIISRVNFRGLTLSDHESISTLKSSYSLYGLELGIKRKFGF